MQVGKDKFEMLWEKINLKCCQHIITVTSQVVYTTVYI